MFRFDLKSGIPALFVLALLLGLGTWQVQRLAWKESLIADMQAARALPPLSLPAGAAGGESLAFRRVQVNGRFTPPVHVLRPRVKDGKAGVEVMMLLRGAGFNVFVNRGWAADDAAAQKIAVAENASFDGFVTVPRRGFFTPDNDPQQNQWYWADVRAMAAGVDVLPFVVTRDAPQAPPNNHLGYAAFWYAMAGIFVFLYILSRREKKA